MDDARIRELIARFDDPWKPTRNEAAALLADAGEGVIPHLRPLLEGPNHDPDKAHLAVWVLEQFDSPEAEALVEHYFDRHG